MPETMTAPPPANPAPVPVATATPTTQTPAAAESKGFFDHQAFPSQKPAEAAPESTEIKPETKAVETPKVYAGRFKTPEELEIAYRESSSEGLRLYQESIAVKNQISELQSKLVEAEERAKLGASIPFKELSKEQFEKLESESPVKAAEYLFDKKLHDRDMAEAQKQTKAQRETSERNRIQTQNYIIERGKDLSSNPDKYPHYNELMSDMEFVSKKLGNDIVGKGWAPDFLYLVALGRMYHSSLLKGKTETKEVLGKTKADVSAVATATSAGGASPTDLPGKADPNSDQAFIERILKAGNKPYFKV